MNTSFSWLRATRGGALLLLLHACGYGDAALQMQGNDTEHTLPPGVAGQSTYRLESQQNATAEANPTQALTSKQRALYGAKQYVTVQPFLPGDKPWSIAKSYIQLAIIEKEKDKKKKDEKDKGNQTRDQLIESYESIYASKKNIALGDIPGLFQKTRKVLLIGRAGIGKTTVCKKLAHMWAKEEWGQEFEAVYVLPVRALNNYKGELDLKHAIARACFSDGKYIDATEVKARDVYLEQQLRERGDKVLLILDGLDEANDTAKALLAQAKNKEKYGLTAQLWVSRPYGVSDQDRQGAVEIENMGFNSDQVKQYTQEYFSKDTKSASKATSLLTYLKSHPNVRGTAHVPINLQILCNLWNGDHKEVEAASSSMTKLYDLMAQSVWKRYEKGGRRVVIDGQRVNIRQDKGKLNKLLERIALAGLQQAERQILIDESLIEAQIEKAVEEEFTEDDHREGKKALRELLKQSGFLRSTEDSMRSEFLHLTFQEYFAGRALAHQLVTQTSAALGAKDPRGVSRPRVHLRYDRGVCAFLATNQYKAENQVMLSFMAGEIYKKKKLAGLRKLLDTLNAAPQEALGLQHLLLQLRCVAQCLAVGMPQAKLEGIEKTYGLRQALQAWVQKSLRDMKERDWRLRNPLTTAFSRLSHWASDVVAIYGRALEDKDVRRVAARALGNLGYKEAVAPLLAALRDKDKDVRRVAARALGNLGYKEAIAPLSIALKDPYENFMGQFPVRRVAAAALGNLGYKEAVAPLLAALRDKDSDVRRVAAAALGNLGYKEAVAPLIAALKDDKEDWVRHSVAAALVELGFQGAVDPLIAVLKDEDSNVRRYHAAEVLGQLGYKKASSPLIDVLMDDKHEYVRRSAAKALGQLGDEKAVVPLIAALKDDSVSIRRSVADVLGKLGYKEALSPLINALMDNDRNVRRSAVEALGQLGCKEALPPLSTALKNERDECIRSSAAYALGQLGYKEAVVPLIATLKDVYSDVRRDAAYALGQLGYKEAVVPLIAALKDEDSLVRRSAVTALRQLGFKEAVVPLSIALKDEDFDVRSSAARALGQLGFKEAVVPLSVALKDDKHEDVRYSATEALFKFDTPRLIEIYCQSVDVHKYLPHRGIWKIIGEYCNEALFPTFLFPYIVKFHAFLFPHIVNKIYNERLVIEADGQIMLYQKVSGIPLGKVGERFSIEGIKKLQAGLKEYREGILNSATALTDETPADKKAQTPQGSE